MGLRKFQSFVLNSRMIPIIFVFLFSSLSVVEATQGLCLKNTSALTVPSSLNTKWLQFLNKVSEFSKYKIEGEIGTQFGSSIKSEDSNYHRLVIRNRLSELMSFQSDICDLKAIPRPKDGFSVSLSHTEGLGGFIYSTKATLGFDVELASHLESVKPGVFERVFTPDELALKVPRKYLWSLKEAGLKSLYGQGPRDAREIEIYNIENLSDDILHVLGEYVGTFNVVNFEGWALQIDDYIFAITIQR